MRTGLKRRERKRILLTGTQAGVGTTHFSLALANAACSRERRKTAYLEIGNKGNIATLPSEGTFDGGEVAGFVHLGVHYLPMLDEAGARRFLNDSAWDVVVCDVTDWEVAQRLFPLCAENLLLCNLRPWNYAVFQQRMKELLCGMNEKRVKLYSFHMQRADERRAREEFGIRIGEIPEILDPFRMTRGEATRAAAFLQYPQKGRW